MDYVTRVNKSGFIEQMRVHYGCVGYMYVDEKKSRDSIWVFYYLSEIRIKVREKICIYK